MSTMNRENVPIWFMRLDNSSSFWGWLPQWLAWPCSVGISRKWVRIFFCGSRFVDKMLQQAFLWNCLKIGFCKQNEINVMQFCTMQYENYMTIEDVIPREELHQYFKTLSSVGKQVVILSVHAIISRGRILIKITRLLCIFAIVHFVKSAEMDRHYRLLLIRLL